MFVPARSLSSRTGSKGSSDSKCSTFQIIVDKRENSRSEEGRNRTSAGKGETRRRSQIRHCDRHRRKTGRGSMEGRRGVQGFLPDEPGQQRCPVKADRSSGDVRRK